MVYGKGAEFSSKYVQVKKNLLNLPQKFTEKRHIEKVVKNKSSIVFHTEFLPHFMETKENNQ